MICSGRDDRVEESLNWAQYVQRKGFAMICSGRDDRELGELNSRGQGKTGLEWAIGRLEVKIPQGGPVSPLACLVFRF